MKPLVIAVDFDGTCVLHHYPQIGPDVPGAVDVLRELDAAGHELILWTMRDGYTLAHARDWFTRHGITLHGLNANPDQVSWSSSPKAYAHLYIDDAAVGCPLIVPVGGARPYVDWAAVRAHLARAGVLP